MIDKVDPISEQLKTLSSASFDKLEELYQQLMVSGSAEQRRTLAEDGYLNQGSYMIYDMVCGKLTYADLEYMLVLVARAANLLDEELFEQEEGIRYHMMLHCLRKDDNPDRAIALGQQCLTLNERSLAAQPEDPAYCHNQNAMVYFSLRKFAWAANAKGAVAAVKAAAQHDTFEAHWHIYLELLFINIPELEEWQAKEIIEFNSLAEHYSSTIPGFNYKIAQALHSLIARSSNDLHQHIYIAYDNWLEKAALEPDFKSTYFEIIELVSFFASEGERLGRIDLLDKAIANIIRIQGAQEDKCLALRTQVECIEAKASIQIAENNPQQAQQSIDLARQLCTANETELAKDFSSQLFYAEFLFRCLTRAWGSNLPTTEQIETLTLSAREQAQGHYSAPAMLLVELCLFQGRETQAIHYLTQEFLLHELCLDTKVIDLKQSVHSRFVSMHQLLDDFMAFAAEVGENYYLHTSFDWAQVAKMSAEQAADAWSKLKITIAARPPIE